MNFTLMPHQRETIDYGKKNNYCIYALHMGLGKSLSSLQTAIETNSKALIVCPAYLKLNWKKEIEKFFPDKVVSVLHKKQDFYFPWDSDFVIISYSFLDEAGLLFDWADMVIADECQFLKALESKRSEAFHRHVYENSVKRCLLLTGTPILNRVHEFYSLIAICNYDPRILESTFLQRFPTYVEFANHFSYLNEREIYRGNKRVKIQEWSGYRNVEELKFYLKNCYIRFKSEDVLDLPQYQELFIQVDEQDLPELLAEFDTFRGENDSVASKAKKEAARAKAPLTVEYVKGLLDQDIKVVVYSDHVESTEYIAKMLGVEPITGATKVERRQELADTFQNGKAKVIVATIGSFSTGVNLHSASNMVFNDLSWVPGIMEQAKFRIIRVGQKDRCTFHYIMGSFQDEYIHKKLKEKIETIGAVV